MVPADHRVRGRAAGRARGLDWSELSKRLQREWIGRSTGADVAFAVTADPRTRLTAFTTRADTLFGVTFVAVAPEHPVVGTLITTGWQR